MSRWMLGAPVWVLFGWLVGCDAADVDLDDDGVLAIEDCDDADPNVFPGAPELCDGVDNNCDGEVDVGAADAARYYLDADGDGFGDRDSSTRACTRPANHVPVDGDCDDADPTVYPDAPEVRDDGVDQSCDGTDVFHTRHGWTDDAPQHGVPYAADTQHLTRIEVTRDGSLVGWGGMPARGDQVHFAVYADRGGEPGDLLTSTRDVPVVVNDTEAWLDHPIDVREGAYWVSVTADTFSGWRAVASPSMSCVAHHPYDTALPDSVRADCRDARWSPALWLVVRAEASL